MAKKSKPRRNFKDRTEEAEYFASLAFANRNDAFEDFSGKFMCSDTPVDSHKQYAEMNQVLQPERRVEEWLFHQDGPFLTHSSQIYHTHTLTSSGFVQDRHFQISPDIDCTFPPEMMFQPQWYSSSLVLEDDDLPEKGNEEELTREFGELDLGFKKQRSSQRRSARIENRDASEWKHPRGGIRKHPRG
ncbi:hypothetical protein Dda_6777 [Drechslerella dactyloides]|uniref:Uncharacterized protein n=1 Tax=Drechslerella dactyloides TaxID=74499 RepID=A0AAD6IUJ3_DREDA|nr:hypothetical protein Dda_6777 [Drechslerella dactyloides]